MQNKRLLVIGLLIAVALAWLYFVLPGAPRASRSTPAARVAPAPPKIPEIVTPAPAAPEVVAPPPEEPIHEGPKKHEPAPPHEPPPAAEEPGVENTTENANAVPPADPDRAADLFADLLAKQEAEPEEGRLPNPARDLWKRFDKEQSDEAWSAPSTEHLQDSLDAWIDTLPEEMGDHVALVHVECRASLCQVLAADNDLAGQGARADAGQEWQQAIAALRGQPWWTESGFVDMTTQVTSSDGYVLYTTYLLRAANPPSP